MKFISILTVSNSPSWESAWWSTKTYFTFFFAKEKKFHICQNTFVLDEHFIMPTISGRFSNPYRKYMKFRQKLWECKSLVITNFNFIKVNVDTQHEQDGMKKPFKVHVDINMLHQNHLINFSPISVHFHNVTFIGLAGLPLHSSLLPLLWIQNLLYENE